MDIKGLKEYVVNYYREHKVSHIPYHNLDHILDVFEASGRIARDENLSEYKVMILQASALLHDIALLHKKDDHEQNSALLSQEILPVYGFGENECNEVSRIICSTVLPQQASDIEEMVICDADLDYLGRDDFFMISHRLRYEWFLQGRTIPLREWYELQICFLEEHQYFTASAKVQRDSGKQNNIQTIKELLRNNI